ncbi:MAG TPA: tetratricopeptide repeat protein, partial [Bacteroidetes bacterium]|nr:tetratricopeptide repeat protein [Bacteroidota bacterium]
MTETTFRKKGALNFLLLGGVIGLTALARPLVLIFVPLLFLAFILDDKADWVKRSLWLTAGVLILLIPVGIRNLAVGGEFTLTTSSAGMNFYVGNNPEATGLYWEAPFLSSVEPQYEDEDYRRVASEAMERELSTGEAGQYWFNRSLDWIIHEPFSYLKLLGRKVFLFWNRAEFANNISIYYGRQVSPIIAYNPFGFWLIGPLGLAGLILLWRKRGWKRVRVPLLWIFTYFAGSVIFFVASEYRLAALPALIICAAYLLVEIFNHLKERRMEPAMRLVALGLLFMPLSNFRTSFIYHGENPRMDYFNLGNTLLKQGKNLEAVSRFQRSLAIDPYFAEGLMKLAEAYSRAGMNDKAIEIGRRAGLEKPESIIDMIQVQALQEAYSLMEEGKFEAALDEFNFAGLDMAQASAETTRVYQLKDARTALKEGHPDKALELFKQVNAGDDSSGTVDPILLHNIASLYLRMGVLDSAEHYACEALEVDSMSAPTAYLMARILNASGRWEEAERLIMRVTPDAFGMKD